MTEQQTRPAPDTTPRTEAGRELFHDNRNGMVILSDAMRSRILAIEAEARLQVVEQIRREVHDYMEHANMVAGELKIDRDDFAAILDEVAASRLPVREEERP